MFVLEEGPGLRNLLSYVEDGTQTEGDALVEGIASEVAALNRDDEVMAMIFTMQDEIDIQAAWAYEKGEARGRAEGIVEGEARGEAKGEARLSDLINRLLGNDRIEDAKRATTDAAYRQELFKEFGIA